ncbi:MAG: YbaB/EbfC family nucleoid-associated protein [Clostridiales Family XIII bacterium]|jgi:DNA-binding YbaB/EbfC family protein|nr:YbaB/EbfC family nucleoid-associated protein [Clostridiales Family XIII bacterium]
MGKGMKAGKKPGGGKAQDGQKQLRQIQALRQKMDEAQEEIDLKEVEATAGGNAVKVRINGKKELVSVVIDPDALDDVETLQDMILVAVNEGLRQIEEISKSEMARLTDGLPALPGMF